MDRIGEMMGKALSRVLISLDELRDYREDLCRDLMLRPFDHIPALETALREVRRQGRARAWAASSSPDESCAAG